MSAPFEPRAGYFRMSRKSDREELRALPRPLYRYERSEATGPDPGWIDGEVVAFVQGGAIKGSGAFI
jgi:hypothetical protein